MTEPRFLDIGEVVEQTGVPVTTLHLWERRGLLTPTGRVGLRRQYDPAVIRTIAVIVVAQQSGFSLDEIAGLLEPGAFSDGKELLQRKLTELQARRDDLDRAIAGLEHALACTHPSPLDCPNFGAHLSDVLPRTPRANDTDRVPGPRG
jgi:DNA-binding transcriptional MerR regulator